MTALTMNGPVEMPDPERDPRVRPIALTVIGLAVLIAVAGAFGPVEAGSCTGYAALEAPLLPQTV